MPAKPAPISADFFSNIGEHSRKLAGKANPGNFISDGEKTVELISVGANPHTQEMLVVYLPQEKFMFQGDLFYFNSEATFPAKDRLPGMFFFAEWLKKNNLSPTRIYGFHSVLYGTMEHIEKILEFKNGRTARTVNP